MEGKMKVNLNQNVLIKMTDAGFKHIANNYNEFIDRTDLKWEHRNSQHYKNMCNDDGMFKMQLYVFLEVFGGFGIRITEYVDIMIDVLELK